MVIGVRYECTRKTVMRASYVRYLAIYSHSFRRSQQTWIGWRALRYVSRAPTSERVHRTNSARRPSLATWAYSAMKMASEAAA